MINKEADSKKKKKKLKNDSKKKRSIKKLQRWGINAISV
jgi:hypothetical protein